MSKDLISIIVPTYNRARTLKSSINSLINQTYPNIEIIIVDDGSIDNTQELVSSIDDSRIKYIKLDKNYGACYARNIGIKVSLGKYIMFNDSDDTFNSRKVEIQYKNILENKSDMDFCKLRIHSNDTIIEIPTESQLDDINKNGLVTELCKANFISTQSFIVKKSILEKYLFDENLPRLQDYDLFLRLIPHIKVSFTNLFLADLYRQTDSISRSNVRLSKAIGIMYAKEYNLSRRNLESLHQQIFRINEDLSSYMNLLETNLQSSQSDVEKLNSELEEMTKNLQRIKREKEEIEQKYYKVVNSRVWKFLDKARRIGKNVIRK